MFKLLMYILSISSVFAVNFNNNNQLSFQNEEIIINVANNDCSKIGLTNDDLLELATTGIKSFWNTVATSRLKIVKGRVINNLEKFSTEKLCNNISLDGTCDKNTNLMYSTGILISCNDNQENFQNNSLNILGATIINNSTDYGNIVSSLILINNIESSQFVNLSKIEKVSTIAHEIGHAIGLGHSSFENNLMYPINLENRNKLGTDDIDSVTYLYPLRFLGITCSSIQSIDKPNNTINLFFGFFLIILISSIKKLKIFLS